MLELQSISKRYGQTTAVETLDLTLRAGRTYVLIGPSGCGKSTLLKLIIGLVESDSGSVRIGDQQLSRANRLSLRRSVGYVIQEGGLFPHLTARQNVVLVARYLRWKRHQMDQRVDELVGLTHLSHDILDRFPGELSGGQRQRISLMRALMLDPDVLLLDEPLGALDPMIRSELQDDLRKIFRSLNKTVVMVTHDLHEAAYFADEVLLMRAGRVVQRGVVNDLLRAPVEPFVTNFVNAQRAAWPGDE